MTKKINKIKEKDWITFKRIICDYKFAPYHKISCQ